MHSLVVFIDDKERKKTNRERVRERERDIYKNMRHKIREKSINLWDSTQFLYIRKKKFIELGCYMRAANRLIYFNALLWLFNEHEYFFFVSLKLSQFLQVFFFLLRSCWTFPFKNEKKNKLKCKIDWVDQIILVKSLLFMRISIKQPNLYLICYSKPKKKKKMSKNMKRSDCCEV